MSELATLNSSTKLLVTGMITGVLGILIFLGWTFIDLWKASYHFFCPKGAGIKDRLIAIRAIGWKIKFFGEKAKLKVDDCEPIKNDECKKACIFFIALFYHSETLCDKLKGTDYYLGCIQTVASERKNPDICLKLKDSERDSCLKQVANVLGWTKGEQICQSACKKITSPSLQKECLEECTSISSGRPKSSLPSPK
jgi:hypothetical protein